MTKMTLELAAVDDRAAMCLMRTLCKMLEDAYLASPSLNPFAPGYDVSDLDGSVVVKVTREDGPQRGEVTL